MDIQQFQIEQDLVNTSYKFLGYLGSGTFAQALLLENTRENKNYAAKYMKYMKSESETVGYAIQELTILKDLNHVNIVRYVNNFKIMSGNNITIYIIMELCGGGDLDGLIKDHTTRTVPFTEDRIWHFSLQILEALAYMHGLNPKVLHRDLKPANIFLTSDRNTIKLGDFGVSRWLAKPTDLATTLCGTPQYLSPEKGRGEKYNQKEDIWAAGCCIREMMLLDRPTIVDWDQFKLQTRGILVKPVPAGYYSQDLIRLTDEMLDMNSSRRPDAYEILSKPLIKIKKAEVDCRDLPPVPMPRQRPGTHNYPDGATDQLFGVDEPSIYSLEVNTLVAPPAEAQANGVYEDDNEYSYAVARGFVIPTSDSEDGGSFDNTAGGRNLSNSTYIKMDKPTTPVSPPRQATRELLPSGVRHPSPGPSPSQNPQVAQDPQAKLMELGYKFNTKGELRGEGNRRYQFEGEQKYEMICIAMTEYLDFLLTIRHNMVHISIPIDAAPDEPSIFIYGTKDLSEKVQKILVIVHGSGKVKAGQWARRLIINDSMDDGSQIPCLVRAKEYGYAVIMASMNDNAVIVDGVSIPIRNSETAQKHLQEIYRYIMLRYPAARVAIFAHSQGGYEVTKLALEREDDFLDKTFAVAFADSSIHENSSVCSKLSSKAKKFFEKHSRNYISSDKPLDTKLPQEQYISPRYSAGAVEHERTPRAITEPALKFLESEFNKPVRNNRKSNALSRFFSSPSS